MSSANPQPEADQQMLSQRARRQNPYRSQPNPSWDLHSLKLSSQIQSSPEKGPSELWAAEAWRARSALEAVRSHSARLPFIHWGCHASWVAPHTQQTLHTQEGAQGSGVPSSGADPPHREKSGPPGPSPYWPELMAISMMESLMCVAGSPCESTSSGGPGREMSSSAETLGGDRRLLEPSGAGRGAGVPLWRGALDSSDREITGEPWVGEQGTQQMIRNMEGKLPQPTWQ